LRCLFMRLDRDKFVAEKELWIVGEKG